MNGDTDIVLVRMDKIGDLVVSLAADQHPAVAGQRVQWLVTQGLKVIPEHAVPRRQASEFPRRFSPSAFFRLVRWFRARRPQTVIFLHNPWWVSCAAWWAGVPERIGRRSQWHSFVFLNLPIRQKRSQSDRHESDYNFDLIEWGMSHLGVRRTSDLAAAKKAWVQLAVEGEFANLPAHYRVVHPGMAGSALNWPIEHYRELIEKLAKEGPVVITGTKMDQKYLAPLATLKDRPGIHWRVEQLGFVQLLQVLKRAQSVVAPSTGVLHLAAALGRPAVGIYSPKRVQHPQRWGAKGPAVRLLLPPPPTSEKYGPEIMAQISVEQVVQAVHELENANPT